MNRLRSTDARPDAAIWRGICARKGNDRLSLPIPFDTPTGNEDDFIDEWLAESVLGVTAHSC